MSNQFLTHIRLILEKQSALGLVCLPFHLHLMAGISLKVKHFCSNVRVIKALFEV